jgi:Ca2+-binding RTX toxin-like protein
VVPDDVDMQPRQLLTAALLAAALTLPVLPAGADDPVTCGGQVVTVFLADGDTPTPGRDIVLGTEDQDIVHTGAGNDVVCGLGGNDHIYAGRGRDRVYGQEGLDQLYGERGNDQLYGGRRNDYFNGGAGYDLCDAGGGNYTEHDGCETGSALNS